VNRFANAETLARLKYASFSAPVKDPPTVRRQKEDENATKVKPFIITIPLPDRNLTPEKAPDRKEPQEPDEPGKN